MLDLRAHRGWFRGRLETALSTPNACSLRSTAWTAGYACANKIAGIRRRVPTMAQTVRPPAPRRVETGYGFVHGCEPTGGNSGRAESIGSGRSSGVGPAAHV